MKIILPMLLVLAGCQTAIPDMPKAPEIVKVPVDRYVPVPEELTRPCDPGEAREQTYAEAKRLALYRLEVIQTCANGDKAKIRALKGTKP